MHLGIHLNGVYGWTTTDPAWTQVSASTGQSIVLRSDGFHRLELQNPKAKEEFMGITVNIWNRAKVCR